MNIPANLTLAAAVLSVAALSAQAASETAGPKRPNIVFLLADDLRVGAMGFEGHQSWSLKPAK
jgi:hypothetical protein